jgi:hypothetical protein
MATASLRRHPATGFPPRQPESASAHEQALIGAKTSSIESIRTNHRRYAAMDQVLTRTPGAVASHWFAAAACVTHPRRGLGTLDGPLGRLAFQPAQAWRRAGKRLGGPISRGQEFRII